MERIDELIRNKVYSKIYNLKLEVRRRFKDRHTFTDTSKFDGREYTLKAIESVRVWEEIARRSGVL